MRSRNKDLSDLIHRGMTRFPKGPPKAPVLLQMRDRVERLLAAESKAERDGIASALIISIRLPEDVTFQESIALQSAGEALIDAASEFLADPESNSTRAELRGAFNTVQAIYCAEVSLEAHVPQVREPEEDAPGM